MQLITYVEAVRVGDMHLKTRMVPDGWWMLAARRYDRELDAINEPYRPIPSGRITEAQVRPSKTAIARRHAICTERAR